MTILSGRSKERFAKPMRRFFRAAEANETLMGMGTTVTVLVLVGQRVLFVHVGDSRLYRLSHGRVTQLTRDDSLVQQMVSDGLITAEQARHHPERSVLLRSLGTRPDLIVTAQSSDRPDVGDCFVLCSDGPVRQYRAERDCPGGGIL
jgi:serine/threonine protein phosphatase PrpC